MASKRLRKKKHKQQLEKQYSKKAAQFKQKSGKKKVTYQDYVTFEKETKKRQAQTDKRFRENLKLIEAANLSDTIIINKNTSTKQVKTLIDNEIKKRQAKARQKIKIDRLISAGFSAKEANKYKNKSYSFIDDLINSRNEFKTYHTKDYLGVCWWDKTGETDLRDLLAEIQTMTADEKKQAIRNRYIESVNDIDNSNGFSGIARIEVGASKSKVEKGLNAYKKRGYGKRVPYNFVKIGISNDFTYNDVLDVMYISMMYTTNLEAKKFYNDLEFFLQKNAPELKDLIFD